MTTPINSTDNYRVAEQAHSYDQDSETDTKNAGTQFIVNAQGEPQFAVIPYQQYLALQQAADNNTTLPHEVVGLMIEKDLSPLAAWRKYRGLSQAQLAQQLGISQAAVAQTEKNGNKPHFETLKNWAAALQCEINQLSE